MNRIIASLLAATLLAVSLPAQATSYGGYVRNWWVEPSGDIMFYFWNVDNTTSVTGLCGGNGYRLRTTNANFDEAYASFLLAAKNSYRSGWRSRAAPAPSTSSIRPRSARQRPSTADRSAGQDFKTKKSSAGFLNGESGFIISLENLYRVRELTQARFSSIFYSRALGAFFRPFNCIYRVNQQ